MENSPLKEERALPIKDERAPPIKEESEPELEALGLQSLGAADSRPKRRVATVYDAVAGRVSLKNALRDEGIEQQQQQQPGRRARIIKHLTRSTPLGPDELLFQRKDAPQRYAERDIYYANERELPHGGRGVLPESDLLKAIHAYSSRFYGALARRRPLPGGRSGVDECSMDGTALLAFGILLEEAGREVLGRRGDLVFTRAGRPAADGDGDEVARDGDEPATPVGRSQQAGWPRGGSSEPQEKRRRIT